MANLWSDAAAPAAASSERDLLGRRRRGAALAFFALVAATTALAWSGYAQHAAVAEGLRRVLAALGERRYPEAAAARLGRAEELAREAGSSRDRLAAEASRREDLERGLAAARAERPSSGPRDGERDPEGGAEAAPRTTGSKSTGEGRPTAPASSGPFASLAPAAGPAAEADRLRTLLAVAEARLRAAEAAAVDLARTANDPADLRPGDPASGAGQTPAGTTPPAASPDLAAYARSAFADGLRGDGRFELRGDGSVAVRTSAIFPEGRADISGEGRAALAALGERLRAAIAAVPPGVPWALRVDGHADDLLVKAEGRFASNWELSAVRASAVVDFLVAAGLPPERMIATAFADTRPLVEGADEEARSRNRRIELRLLTP